jgi:hypothetical protein
MIAHTIGHTTSTLRSIHKRCIQWQSQASRTLPLFCKLAILSVLFRASGLEAYPSVWWVLDAVGSWSSGFVGMMLPAGLQSSPGIVSWNSHLLSFQLTDPHGPCCHRPFAKTVTLTPGSPPDVMPRLYIELMSFVTSICNHQHRPSFCKRRGQCPSYPRRAKY